MTKNLICALYNHPEGYPPTLNAIEQLSKDYDNIYLLYRPYLHDKWQYPANVKLIKSGNYISVKDQAKLSVVKKVQDFLLFTFSMLKLTIRHKPRVVLLYDAIPLFAFFLCSKISGKPQVAWYHNHDVIGKEHRKYSIGWFAANYESAAFKKLDIFSLPSDERRKYFDLSAFTGRYFCIPNYPSQFFYNRFSKPKKAGDVLKLIYQGSISKGHGIEEMITFISNFEGNVSFTLIGNVSEVYRDELTELKKRLCVDEKVHMLSPVNYAELPAITATHDIGLAIHTPHNIIYATGGTASNKIYEYAALGLPILYFDNEHYNQILSKYKWTFATDLSFESIQRQIEFIKINLLALSETALIDFREKLNFETAFLPVKKYLATPDVLLQ